MEVSSHSLAMFRVHGIRFAAATFTNLTQDHLDFHRSMDEYFRSKKMLFDMLPPDAVGVTNMNDPNGRRMIEGTVARTVTYGTVEGADVTGRSISTGVDGTRLTVQYRGESNQISSRLIGDFNASNILAAYATCVSVGVPHTAIIEGIGAVRSVRGRFEPIHSKEGWTAVIDYAHTPDALENTLRTIRGLLGGGTGKAITIFGCGGDRDRSKRPTMGAIASSMSDTTIVTSDNPRSEDPLSIMKEVMAGVRSGSKVYQETDRRKAIVLGLEMARAGDIVLIAGKGHETYQIIGKNRAHFDDREEVLRFLGSS
jgi:UDP-N-acetylmuramoyl-L-alanyl-D-glutamate--2,6-diaminopimelate ligase